MGRWRSSAAYRIAFISFGAYAAGIAILGLVIFFVMHVAFARQLDAMVIDEARTMAEEYHRGGQRELAEAVVEREASTSPTRMLYAVFSSDGRRLLGSLQVRRPPVGVHDVEFFDSKEGPDLARAATIDLSRDLRIVVAVDSDWAERSEEIVVAVFGLALVGACVLGLAGAVMLGRYLERRLRTISQSAEVIIGGDIRQRMWVSPHRDEFDELAITLNRMLDRIEGLLDNLRQVSSDIAHDLRTPLARLRNLLERGLSAQKENKPEIGIVEAALGRVDDVLSLFSAILRIAEVESGETRRFFEIVDISALVVELAESYGPAVHDRGRTLLSSVEADLTVFGDRELLSQAAINLLENAQQHTPAATFVRITATRVGRMVCLQVVDSGPGIPKADITRVTRRFARLDRSRSTAGHGLGLSLVDAIAKLHGGKLVLRDAQPGLAATIELPFEAAKLAPTSTAYQESSA